MAKILIIDDSIDDIDTIKTILEKNKHNTKTASSGRDAIKLIDSKIKFDLILTDIFLPDVSGYKLVEIIREKLGRTVKCMYVTIVPKREIDETRIDGFIQKPFLPKDLIKEVNDCLNIKNSKH